MQPYLGDVDAAACSLHLTKSYRPGLGREIVQSPENRSNVGIDWRCGGRVQIWRRALINLHCNFDHRSIGGWAFRHPAMKLVMPCARHAFTRGTIRTLDRKQIEYQRA